MTEPGGAANERRFDVRWHFWAGHHALGAVRGHTIACGLLGMLVSVPAEYDLNTYVEFELWITATRFLTVVGKITRAVDIQSAHGYEVTFHSMPDEDRKYLADLMLAMRRAEYHSSFG